MAVQPVRSENRADPLVDAYRPLAGAAPMPHASRAAFGCVPEDVPPTVGHVA